MISLKIHNSSDGKIIALCDSNLLGTVLSDGKICLDLQKYRDFYEGEEVGPFDAKKFIRSSFSSLNIVGPDSVAIAIQSGILSKNDILHINNIPYVQIYML